MLAARHPADILVLDADPRRDPRNLAAIDMVVADGRMLRREALDGLLGEARDASREEAPIYRAVVEGHATEAVAIAAGLGAELDVATARVLGMRLYAHLEAPRPRNHFTVGIVDDVSGTSIEYEPGLDIEPPETQRAVFFGLGSDGRDWWRGPSTPARGEATSRCSDARRGRQIGRAHV